MKKKLAPVFSILLIPAVFAFTLIPAAFAWETPGYWKNRGYRLYGPYPTGLFDDILVHSNLGGGTCTGDFAYEVLWMDKSVGDATLILAFQLIAYRLNVAVLGAYEPPSWAAIAAAAVSALNAAGGIGADPAPGTAIRAECISLAHQLDLMNNDLF